MNIAIISGSHRENSQSFKIASFLDRTIKEGKSGSNSWILNLENNPFPLWDEGIWQNDPGWSEILDPVSNQLMKSDAFIIISPEWHGQVPSGLKNFFLLWGKGELAHKPALIVGVSSATGGAYPVAELRMSSYKNNHICYIPEQLIIRDCETVLNENPENNDSSKDSYYRERSNYALGILIEYAKALKQVRASGVTQTDKFKNGM